MIKRPTIFIAHNWDQTSLASVSYHLSLFLCKDHSVVFLNAKGKREGYKKINEYVEVYDWPNKRPTTIKDFLFFIKLAKRYKPASVIAHFGAVNVCVIGSRYLGVRSITFYHTLTAQIALDIPKNLYSQSLNKFLILRKKIIYKLSHLIIAGTQCAKKDIQNTWNIAGDKIAVVYYGLPETVFRNHYKEIKIGFVGRIDISKGLDLLIFAVGKLIDEGYNLTLEIVGSGEMQAELEKVVLSNGWKAFIVFLGRYPYSKIHEFICTTYIMVLPSRIDNPSIVILEAFATQTPIVGANAGAIPELIEHKKNGLLFQSENIEDLALQIKSLLVNRSLRDKLAFAGRKSFERNYTIETYLHSMKALI